jgi:hypothetical protein
MRSVGSVRDSILTNTQMRPHRDLDESRPQDHQHAQEPRKRRDPARQAKFLAQQGHGQDDAEQRRGKGERHRVRQRQERHGRKIERLTQRAESAAQ